MIRFLAYASLCVLCGMGVAAYGTVLTAPATEKPALGSAVVKVSSDDGSGSGVHIGRGFIVTAAHVVAGKTVVQVKTFHGVEGHAQVLWANLEYDIALLQSDVAAGISRLRCEAPAVGEDLEVIGNPSTMEFIHSWGRAAGRVDTFGRWKTAFVANLTVAPGVSGAPAYDLQGRVVGIAVGVAVTKSFPPALTGYAYIVPASAVCKLLGM